MRVGPDPLLIAGDASFVSVRADAGSTLSYGRSRTSTPNSLTVGSSALLAGPIWVVSQGASTDVTVTAPARAAAFEGQSGVTIFVGPSDPGAASQDGDVWIQTS